MEGLEKYKVPKGGQYSDGEKRRRSPQLFQYVTNDEFW